MSASKWCKRYTFCYTDKRMGHYVPDGNCSPRAAFYKPWTACMSMKTIGIDTADTLITWHGDYGFPIPHTSMERLLNYNRSALSDLPN
jgi:hypothetical protein